MNKVPSEAENWLSELQARLQSVAHDHAEIALCAPFTHLAGLGKLAKGSPVAIGAQDVSAHEQGAYTGEVSAAMLKDLNVTYVIIGHSERREYHAESDELVNGKVKTALAYGLRPILCVGETLEQREAGQATEVVLKQLRADLAGVAFDDAEDLTIAYEPIWAIGTGKTATSQDAQDMCQAIRQELVSLYPKHAAKMRILYGGSMNPGNATELLAQADINGGLIGGASLDIDSLLLLIKAAK